MKLIKFSIEVKSLKLIRLIPTRFMKKSIEEWIQEKYSSLETLNDFELNNKKNLNKEEKKKIKCKTYNRSIWNSIEHEFVKLNIIKDETLLVASHEKRKINYYIYKDSESNRKCKKEVSLDIIIISDENRNIDMIANEVIKHIKRKLWFMDVSIVKDGGATIYFEKDIKGESGKKEIKTISADIIQSNKMTLVEIIYSTAVSIIGISLILIGLSESIDKELEGILISIGTSLIAATIGLIINSFAEAFNKGIKISIIDLNSLAEDTKHLIKHLVADEELDSVDEFKNNKTKDKDDEEKVLEAIGVYK